MQRYYEQGETAGGFWPTEPNNNIIVHYYITVSVLVTDTVDINEAFRVFYQKLYTSQCTADQNDIDHFLSQVNLPSLSEEKQKETGGDITL